MMLAPILLFMGKTNNRAGRKAGQGSKWIRKTTRLAIYHRDGFCCVFCGQGSEDGVKLTLDHVIACENGGSNAPENLVTCCGRCNSSKQDITIRSWYVRLRTRGFDTKIISARVRRALCRPLDRAEGRRLEALRYAA